MKRILIIEDDPVIRQELKSLLSKNNYQADILIDMNTYLDYIKENLYNIILLDINLPNMSGYIMCKEIKKIKSIPIIFVTCRNTENDELRSITSGGDDFITKPYNTYILLEKIKRAIDKSGSESQSKLEYKDVVLDLINLTITHGSKMEELSKNEFKIMHYFFINTGRDITKVELIEYLWNSRFYLDDNTLTVNIKRIRKKLENIDIYELIKTIHGTGYRI